MTVNEVESKMTERELANWVLFDQLRPLPDEAGDIHNAMLCALALNMFRSPDAIPIDPNDFRIYRPVRPEEEMVKPKSEAERFKMAVGG